MTAPWNTAFKVAFNTEKFGIKFAPAKMPDTGNGIYRIAVDELNEKVHDNAAMKYNDKLQSYQQHLKIQPGLVVTHVNGEAMENVDMEYIIDCLKRSHRPTVIRFANAADGVVSKIAPRYKKDIVEDTPEVDECSNQEEEPVLPIVGEHFRYKVILLGSPNVGKSSFLSICVDGDDNYLHQRPATLEAEFANISLPNPDMNNHDNKLSCQLWDTAGQERYQALTRSHYRKADGALIVYDVADEASFEATERWLKDLKTYAGDSLKSIFLVENKVDQLPTDNGGISPRPSNFVNQYRVQLFCQKHGIDFVRTSAKSNKISHVWQGERIQDVMKKLVYQIHAATLSRKSANYDPPTISLSNSPESPRHIGCC